MPVTDLKDRTLYRFGPFLADFGQRRLWNNKRLVSLTPKVFQTFAILFENRDRIVTKQELLETLWPDSYVDEANLTQNISVLRKALGETGSATKYIVTFPKRGYRFVAEASEVDDSGLEEPVPAVNAVKLGAEGGGIAAAAEIPTSPKALPWLWVTAATMMIVLSSAAFWPALRAGRITSGPAPQHAGIRLTNLTGDEYQPAASPDGSKVAFVHFASLEKPLRIGIIRPGASVPGMLDTPGCDAFSPAWSPDGKSLAYLCQESRRLRLVIRNEANVERTVAELFPVRDATSMRHLDWSPDGRMLAVCDKRSSEDPFRIELIHIAEGRRTVLTEPPALSDGDFEPRFSPDGKRLAFIRAKSRRSMEVLVLRMPGNAGITELTKARAAISGLDWMPDSKSLLFCARREGENHVWQISADRENGVWEPAPNVGKQPLQLSVSRKTGMIVATSGQPGQSIWGADLRQDERLSWRRRMSSSGADFSPTFDVTGKRVAFLSDRTGNVELWVRHENGRDAQLTNGDLAPNYPSWSHDGTRLYFSSYTWRKLFRVGLEGRAPTLVDVDGPVGGHIAVTPDDNRVLMAERYNIYEAPVDGGIRKLVSDQGGFPIRQDSAGDALYYVRSRFSHEIWSLRRSTSEVRMVTDQLWPGCWGLWDLSKSGILVYVTGIRSGIPQLARIDLSTGKSTLLGPLMTRQATLRNGRLALSPDATQVLIDVIEPGEGDIYAQETR